MQHSFTLTFVDNEIEKFRKLILTAHAMAAQLKNQGHEICNVPCEFNQSVKIRKKEVNERLAKEWEEGSEFLHNLSDYTRFDQLWSNDNGKQ
jgi:hypothetical protein